MKRVLIFLIAIQLFPAAMRSADSRFMREAADKVWNARPELFDPKREIPDSLRESVSAVVLGCYDNLNADYMVYDTPYGVETRAECITFTRKMVKLLDRTAVENFSKHEFGSSQKAGIRFRQNIAESDNAFGAKIHKPDGTVKDVDVSKAYNIDEGKKGGDDKLIKKIIDIPGLEPGDVLEYFTCTRYRTRELDLPYTRITVSDEYPVMEAVVECTFDPKLTVEFRGYNGVPDLETGKNKAGDNTAYIHLENIPMMTDTRFVNRWREIPFYDFFVLNNTSPYRYYPKYSRAGGLYQNPLAGTIFRDISLMMAASNYDKSNLPGKIRGIIKNYRKAHPEATTEELTDMAWIATNYANAVSKDNDASDYWLALMFSDILKKEKLSESASVAFIMPANNVATGEIINWRQPDFGTLVGEKLYLSCTLRSFLPGELPGEYQGQICATYPGDRDKLWEFTMPKIMTTDVSKSNDNKILVNAVVSLGEDDNATIENEITFTGAMKDASEPFVTDSEWLAEQEDFLEIEPGKRYKDKYHDPEARSKKLKEYAGELYDAFHTGESSKISNVVVVSRGITSDAPDFKLKFTSSIQAFTARAGNDIIVKIGQLAGNNSRIEGIERNRTTDINYKSAYQENYTILLNIPEGYSVDEKSLESLACNVQTPVGMFISGIKLSPDGKSLTLAVRSRIQRPLFSKAAWQSVLDLTDAASSFADARLVLKKI